MDWNAYAPVVLYIDIAGVVEDLEVFIVVVWSISCVCMGVSQAACNGALGEYFCIDVGALVVMKK